MQCTGSGLSSAFVFAPATGMNVFEKLGPDALWYGIGAMGPLLWIWALAVSRAFRKPTVRR